LAVQRSRSHWPTLLQKKTVMSWLENLDVKT
jgi:hypothetical protein